MGNSVFEVLGGAGTPGEDGAPGSVWRDGTGAPSNGLGIDGDYYLDDATGDVYVKASGTYSVTANIKGATGATGSAGATGSTGATGAAGANGGAVTIPYTFSTTTTDSDPGNGNLRLNQATQNISTVIRADNLDSLGSDWGTVIAAFDDSTAAAKGYIRLVKTTDASKWILFQIVSVAAPSGYKNITCTVVSSSGSNPFSDTDPVLICWERVADVPRPREATVASSTTPTPDSDSTDIYTVTALAAGATFGAPTGTPIQGQALLIRIKDNGTARTLAWNAIYRAFTNATLPTTTVLGKTHYILSVYNSTDTKWDVLGVTVEP